MGARLSQPRGPAGTTESSVPAKQPPPPTPKAPFPRRLNSRTVIAPAAAFTMALLLFVYTRTSIHAAKANAQKHRDADSGGQGLSLLNESRRRHGLAKKIEGDQGGTVTQLGRQIVSTNALQTSAAEDAGNKEEEERAKVLDKLKGRRGEGRDL